MNIVRNTIPYRLYKNFPCVAIQASPNQTSGTNNASSNQPNTVSSQTNKDATTNSNHEHSTNPLNINGSQMTSASSSSILNNNANATFNNDKSASINADLLGNGNGASKIKECVGCGVPCNQTNVSPHGALCNSCYHHWRYSLKKTFTNSIHFFHFIFPFYSFIIEI